jgi:ABC-2 type transport system ATP-binding protein
VEQAPVIELEGLSVRFGKRDILQELRGRLAGRAIGLLGPNGAGKSTLIHNLLGFHQPSAGTARIFGLDIRTHAKEIRASIGYMPENDAFVPGISAVRFVRMMAELNGLPREAPWTCTGALRGPGRGAPASWSYSWG